MRLQLDIRGSGTSFAILQGGRVIGRATSHGNAIARAAGIERKLAKAQRRPAVCLGCGAGFLSSGPGNRLCPTCRKGVD
jgi:hypothetical protein